MHIAYAEFAGEQVRLGFANSGPLPASDEPKGADPKGTAPTREMLAAAVAWQPGPLQRAAGRTHHQNRRENDSSALLGAPMNSSPAA